MSKQTPNKNSLNPFPAWRLRNGVINATNAQLKIAEESCEFWAFCSAGLVFVGVAAEIFIALAHPEYNSLLEQWGSVIADAFVAIGVAGEVLFGRIGKSRQDELMRRTNEKLEGAIDRAIKAELELAKLQSQLAPRTLTKEQFDKLQSLKGQVSTVGMTAASDFEASRFAAEIGLALQYAGIEVQIFTPRIGLNWANIFVVLSQPSHNASVEPLYRAFIEAGLPTGCGDRSHAPMGDIPKDIPVIMVGVKSAPRSEVPPFMAGLSAQEAELKNNNLERQ